MRAFLAVLVLLSPAFADVVYLKNGTKMDGKVLSETDAEVRVRLNGSAQMSFKWEDVDHLELSDRTAAQAELKQRRAGDPLVAARWALVHGLRNDALAIFKELLKTDPENAAAHQGLGHRLHDGKWLSDEEYHAAVGDVKRGGKWVSAEAAAEQDARAKAKPVAPKQVEAPKGVEPTPKSAPRAGNLADKGDDAAIVKMMGAGWRTYSGKRYRLSTNCKDPDRDFDKDLVDAMDAQWDVYCAFFGVQPQQKKLLNVFIWASRGEYDAWCAKEAPIGKGAYGVYVSSYAFSPACLGYRDGLRAALFTGRHEGCHQFYDNYVNAGGSAWSIEGVACYFEGDIPLNEYPYRWEVVRQDLVSGKYSLSDVVEKSDSMPFERCYGLGAAISWFFQEGKGGVYRASFAKFLQKGGHRSADALAKCCGKPLAQLEAEFKAFLAEKERTSLR